MQLDDRTRWHALYVLCVGTLMIVLDATVVNVALPVVQDDLGFTNAGSCLGRERLHDRLRRPAAARGPARRPRRATHRLPDRAGPSSRLASILCGAAQSQAWLVAARFVQGIGGAMSRPWCWGMIVTMFPEPRDQAKAIGMYAFVASAGGSIGLLAGGVLSVGP